MRLHAWVAVVFLGCGSPAAQGPAPATPAAPAGTAPAPRDEELAKLTEDGQRVFESGKPEQAITEYFDKVIAGYQARYAGEKRHIYCAHEKAETLLYMLQAANKGEEAIAIAPTWADALFLKSFALTELHRPAEARVALEKAVALSPSFAPYLAELGFLHHQTKDWKGSLELFKAAEDSVHLITDPKIQRTVRGRCLRGQGYSLVELGDLDGAEHKYRECLAIDPDDAQAKQELDYIKQQRKK